MIARMPTREHDEALRLVDRALDDLAGRNGMFVGRRADCDDADTVVIQTGEDGR
jgi:hypothetical protein